MTNAISEPSLMIHPVEPDWAPPDIDIVIDCLLQTQLIAGSLNNMEKSYFAGEKFVDLITFIGCSPNINLMPDDSSTAFSFIRLTTTPDTTTVLTSQHTMSPHCPACNKAEKQWRNKMAMTGLECSSCGLSSLPWLYNWRKSAGFCRFYIQITEIYPREAIPQQHLLDQLSTRLGINWQYFYYYN